MYPIKYLEYVHYCEKLGLLCIICVSLPCYELYTLRSLFIAHVYEELCALYTYVRSYLLISLCMSRSMYAISCVLV